MKIECPHCKKIMEIEDADIQAYAASLFSSKPRPGAQGKKLGFHPRPNAQGKKKPRKPKTME